MNTLTHISDIVSFCRAQPYAFGKIYDVDLGPRCHWTPFRYVQDDSHPPLVVKWAWLIFRHEWCSSWYSDPLRTQPQARPSLEQFQRAMNHTLDELFQCFSKHLDCAVSCRRPRRQDPAIRDTTIAVTVKAFPKPGRSYENPEVQAELHYFRMAVVMLFDVKPELVLVNPNFAFDDGKWIH